MDGCHLIAAETVNILFCTLSYYPGITGGAERQARLQAEELVRRGHRVTVVCARTEDLRSEEIAGVRIVRLRRIDRRHLLRISYLLHLLLWLIRNVGDYDVVHVHLANLQADIAVAAAHRFRRPAYVKVACGGAVGEVQRFRAMAKLTRWYGLRHAERVQVLSDEIEAELAAIGVAHERMVKIPNGIDLARFRPLCAEDTRRVRKELALPESATIVLFVGRLVDYKGIYDLLQAWPALEGDSARLVIVGATEDQQLDAPPGVIVRSWVDSPLPYLQAADVFVHPSHADGMSNAVLEAMACGCALVATEHGAIKSLLTSGHNAVLVPVRNRHALAEALALVIEDADLRARLAANARESVGRYAIAGIVDRIEAQYGKLLAAGRSDLLARPLTEHPIAERPGDERAKVPS